MIDGDGGNTSWRAPSVLVIDDDPGTRARLAAALDAAGFAVTAVDHATGASEERIVRTVRADRGSPVGSLASGIAHELLNPLAVAFANVELAEREVAKLASHAELADFADLTELTAELADARAALEEVRAIIRDVRTLARPDELAPGPVDVIAVLETVFRVTRNEIKYRAILSTDFAPCPPVEATPGRLGQALLDLLLQILKSLPSGAGTAQELRARTIYNDRAGEVAIELGVPSGAALDGVAAAIEPRVAALGGRIEVDGTTAVRVILRAARAP